MNLAPVMPATDWTGIAIVVLLGLIFVAVAGYILYIKRAPGLQFGEEELKKIAALVTLTKEAYSLDASSPITYEGITFASQEDLDAYKAAQAVIAKHKGGTT